MSDFSQASIEGETSRMHESMRLHTRRRSSSPHIDANDPYFFSPEDWLQEQVSDSRLRDLKANGLPVLLAMAVDPEDRLETKVHSTVGLVVSPWDSLVWLAAAAQQRYLFREHQVALRHVAAWTADEEWRPTVVLTAATVDGVVKVRVNFHQPGFSKPPKANSSPQSATALLWAINDGHWMDPIGRRSLGPIQTIHEGVQSRSRPIGWIDPMGSMGSGNQDGMTVPIFESTVPQPYPLGYMGPYLLWPLQFQAMSEGHIASQSLMNLASKVGLCNGLRASGVRSQLCEHGMRLWVHRQGCARPEPEVAVDRKEAAIPVNGIRSRRAIRL